jgi:hypothetical protein
MREHLQHAAGGGPPAPTRVWLSFLFRPSMGGKTVPMPWRWRFRDQRQLLLVAEAA